MRFAVAHKAATYLMIAFSYVAMIGGGGISPTIALAGFVGLVGSWWWEPPLVKLEKWSWVWTTASVVALVYSILTAVVTGDFLGVGAQFLIWLTVAKSYNRRAARDWQQLYLLAFLMLVAGSVLDADLTYGACFLGFVIAATWALTLFHLRREMEDNLLVKHAADRASERVEVRRILDSKRIVGSRFFIGTGALSFCVFLASAVVFLALPRVGFGFFLKARGGLTLSGFADGVKLGGHGVIKNDDTVVMRVEVDARYGGRDRPEIHWRGVAFDHYEHGQWARSIRAPETRDLWEQPPAGTETHRLLWQDSPTGPKERYVKQDVWLDPLDSDVLFGASMPHIYELASSVRARKPKHPKNDELRLDHQSTIHYTVYSELDGPPVSKLRASSGPLPRDFWVYLQLPPEITARTRLLAKTITAGGETEYDKAVRIQEWLDKNLTYTLELEEPTSEPIDFFLFARKKGHCEYFASAFAILARASGIPVRQVNGFLGGEWNEYQGYVAVRAGDAHSWDEVYFPGAGWVTFDPTPADRNDPLGRGGDGWRARFGRFLDTMRFQWTKWVIEYDLIAQLSLFKDIGSALKSAAGALRDVFVDALRFWWLFAGAIAGVVGVVLWRRRAGPAFVTGSTKDRKRSAIARAFDQAVRAHAKAGHVREPATTPRDFAAKVGDASLRELVDLYYGAEWGGRADGDAQRRAVALVGEITAKLAQLKP